MSETVLIVGLGNIGMMYDHAGDLSNKVFSHAKAVSLHKEFRLVGAVDPDSQHRALFESAYGASAFDELETALDALNPDVVIIASPTHTHAKVLAKVLEYKRLKSVLCEKPLSMNIEEARMMVSECESDGVRLFVNYVRRADPGVVSVRHKIECDDIRHPIKGVCWYSKGLLHNGSHFFNLLEYWLGDFQRANVFQKGRLWDNADPEPDFVAVFEKGTVVFQAVWEEAFSHYTIELLSPSGRLRYEDGGQHIYWQGLAEDANYPGYTVLTSEPESLVNGMDKYQLHVMEMMANALSGKDHTLCTGGEALKTMESVHYIQELANL